MHLFEKQTHPFLVPKTVDYCCFSPFLSTYASVSLCSISLGISLFRFFSLRFRSTLPSLLFSQLKPVSSGIHSERENASVDVQQTRDVFLGTFCYLYDQLSFITFSLHSYPFLFLSFLELTCPYLRFMSTHMSECSSICRLCFAMRY